MCHTQPRPSQDPTSPKCPGRSSVLSCLGVDGSVDQPPLFLVLTVPGSVIAPVQNRPGQSTATSPTKLPRDTSAKILVEMVKVAGMLGHKAGWYLALTVLYMPHLALTVLYVPYLALTVSYMPFLALTVLYVCHVWP